MNILHHCPWTDRQGNKHNTWIEARDMPGDWEVVDEVCDGNGYFVKYDDANIRNGVVVDIGAHIGCVSAQALALQPRLLIAIEPNGDNFDLLTRNVDRAKQKEHAQAQVHLIRAAAGDPMRGSGATTEGDSSRTIAHYEDVHREGTVPIIGWKGITELTDGAPIAFLKIDCEGGEYDLFETMAVDALANVNRLHLEWHTHGIGAQANIGEIVRRLLYTHTVECFGRPDQGGMLAARKN